MWRGLRSKLLRRSPPPPRSPAIARSTSFSHNEWGNLSKIPPQSAPLVLLPIQQRLSLSHPRTNETARVFSPISPHSRHRFAETCRLARWKPARRDLRTREIAPSSGRVDSRTDRSLVHGRAFLARQSTHRRLQSLE